MEFFEGNIIHLSFPGGTSALIKRTMDLDGLQRGSRKSVVKLMAQTIEKALEIYVGCILEARERIWKR